MGNCFGCSKPATPQSNTCKRVCAPNCEFCAAMDKRRRRRKFNTNRSLSDQGQIN